MRERGWPEVVETGMFLLFVLAVLAICSIGDTKIHCGPMNIEPAQTDGGK